jgi:hypothetical protein
MMPPRRFASGNDAPLPYSDRKALGGALAPPWRIEDLVYAQRRACAGASNDEIAAEMGLPYYEIARVLNDEPTAAPPARERRQESAGVARPDLKRRGFSAP